MFPLVNLTRLWMSLTFQQTAHSVTHGSTHEQDIKATIPSEATAAETARQAVRDKYAAMQTAIDAATTTEQIKAAMP